jgi:hypothetical protein
MKFFLRVIGWKDTEVVAKEKGGMVTVVNFLCGNITAGALELKNVRS